MIDFALITFTDIPQSARYQRPDILAWLISEYLCSALEENPDAAIKEMKAELEKFWHRPNFIAPKIRDEWKALLDGPPAMIVSVLRADTDHGAHMRQICPLGNLLSDEARQVIIATARRLDNERPAK